MFRAQTLQLHLNNTSCQNNFGLIASDPQKNAVLVISRTCQMDCHFKLAPHTWGPELLVLKRDLEREREEEAEEQTSLVITEVDGILLIPETLEADSGCCNVGYGKAILFCQA